MPVKIGGGNKLQYYDKDAGEYSDEQKLDLNEIDKENLVMYHYYGIDDETIVFHFPNYKIHDIEYCEMFCQFAKDKVTLNEINDEKIIYLLKFDPKKDKSTFLNNLGYNLNNIQKLKDDIFNKTFLKSLLFTRINKWGMSVIAPTKLNGTIVTSVWMLNADFTLRFITLIPGGDKIWKNLK